MRMAILIVAAIAMVPAVRAAETVQVHALDCVLEVPATYEFVVSPASEVRISSRDLRPAKITISKLDPEYPPRALMKPQGRTTSGPLTIETYIYEESRVQGSKPFGFTIVRGRKQQLEFSGLSAAEVDAYVAQCLKTMSPDVLASAARSAQGCKGQLSLDQVTAAVGTGVRAQPVFTGGGLKGWRLYGTRTSAQLRARGIEEGALMTHICGVPGSEISASDGNACCSVDVAREFEVTFHAADRETHVIIKR